MDVGVIGLPVPPERRRNTDADRVAFAQAIEIAGRGIPSGFDSGRDALGADVLDERFTTRKQADLRGIDVEPEYGETALMENQREGQAHVALPDDADHGSSCRDTLAQGFHSPPTRRSSTVVRGARRSPASVTVIISPLTAVG